VSPRHCLAMFLSVLSLLIVDMRARAAEDVAPTGDDRSTLDLGDRRELFVDHALIDRLDNVELRLATPRDEGEVFRFDQPWEGTFTGYCTVLDLAGVQLASDQPPLPRYRLYYRGMPEGVRDGSPEEVTCVAESADGVHWTRPELNLFPRDGRPTNIVLADAAPFSHNFSPFIDARPDCPADERFKALAGLADSGLAAFASADGLRWRKVRDEAVIPHTAPFRFVHMFDSQNVSFWSAAEGSYVCYFRVWDGVRRIARADSDDFLHWSDPVLMDYRHGDGPAPIEQLYTNQTQPYFRAPHVALAIAARFVEGRRVINDREAAALGLAAGFQNDVSDTVLMSTRGGHVYDRTFLEGFVRPGIGTRNWVSRTNYPALGVVQTGPAEMSLYVNQDYAQPTAHLRRYSLRLDGFASAQAPYSGGELLTRPLRFEGNRLTLNFSTSAAGSIRVEIQDATGQPLPGFTLDDAIETIGNEIERTVEWKCGGDLSSLAGQPVRLRFVMQDADLFALRFAKE
jgi:hypothetical protein